MDFIKERPRTAALYSLLAIGCLTVWKTLEAKATGQYDYILTLSAALQTLAFLLLVFDTQSNAAEGLSEKSLYAFFIAHITRLSTTFWGEGYVPEDNTGDVYLYQILEVVGVLCCAFQLLKLNAVRGTMDVGQGVERWSMLIGMCCAALVLAYKTHSTGHNDYFADMSWMFSVWLESFALAPQVHFLVSNPSTRVDDSALHFAGLTLAAALTFAFFWGRNTRDHMDDVQKEGTFFYAIVIAGILRVVMCGTYFYLFNKTAAAKKGAEYELCGQDEL